MVVFIIALFSWAFWQTIDASKSYLVLTSILIIACPCALGLSAPFTLGSMMRILSKLGFYVKEASVLERMSAIDSLVFDKTGTLTDNKRQEIVYKGMPLSQNQQNLVKSLVRNSNHSLSKSLNIFLSQSNNLQVSSFREVIGFGIEGFVSGHEIKLGSSKFVGNKLENNLESEVNVSIDGKFFGKYIFLGRLFCCA